MCLACEEEDRYFLYLEMIERARRAARGEKATPNAAWLWPTFVKPAPAPATTRRRAATFICDTPE